ncbi:hypothetical protein AG1IA_06608 [Rhizoctonia solani AG-1 IA]|uniref:Uncharacterized protein n=1 Tax=Thanatephorus cucumeris (strain AG1-IA) TaxID=983506 RepID=L8WN36_THACA|nr:hypothetical protein AG1IA_06608 [Rhizoctonia solani AG-1 IA]
MKLDEAMVSRTGPRKEITPEAQRFDWAQNRVEQLWGHTACVGRGEFPSGQSIWVVRLTGDRAWAVVFDEQVEKRAWCGVGECGLDERCEECAIAHAVVVDQ